jgi:hypothetical protein
VGLSGNDNRGVILYRLKNVITDNGTYVHDPGNKEDEEAPAAGRESDVYERMVMDEG